jgi:hypothetical protein
MEVADRIVEGGITQLGRLLGWLAPVAVALVMGHPFGKGCRR